MAIYNSIFTGAEVDQSVTNAKDLYTDGVTDLDTLGALANGVKFFNFENTATGASVTGGGYDAVGMQISQASQTTQIVSAGESNRDLLWIRVDDGGGFSDWKTIAIGRTESGTSDVINEGDTYITSESIITDTSVAADLVNVTCLRVGDVAVISGRVDLSGFDEAIPSDANISFTYDIERRAIAEGWFTSITATSYGAGTISLSGPGTDNPHFGMRVSASTLGLKFYTGEVISAHSDTTSLEAAFSIVVNVSD